MIVVAGSPTLLTPEGETALEAGDVVCSRWGLPARTAWETPATGTSASPCSPTRTFEIIEYPDSDKVDIWGRHDEALVHMIRRSPELD